MRRSGEDSYAKSQRLDPRSRKIAEDCFAGDVYPGVELIVGAPLILRTNREDNGMTDFI